LDVGAFDFLLIFTRYRGGQLSAPTDLQLKRADYSGWMEERQGRECYILPCKEVIYGINIKWYNADALYSEMYRRVI